jgi:hypothetical protein
MKKAERLHLQKVASDGCVVCRLFEGVDSGPCEIHHIRTGMGTTRANHFQVIGLCAAHHRTGGYGVAIHAGRKGFEERYMTEMELLSELPSRGIIRDAC